MWNLILQLLLFALVSFIWLAVGVGGADLLKKDVFPQDPSRFGWLWLGLRCITISLGPFAVAIALCSWAIKEAICEARSHWRSHQ